MLSFSALFGGKDADLSNSSPAGGTSVNPRIRLSSLAKGFVESDTDQGKPLGVIAGLSKSPTGKEFTKRSMENAFKAAMSAHGKPDRMFVEQMKALIGGDSYEVNETSEEVHHSTEPIGELQESAMKLMERMGPMAVLRLVVGWMEHELSESPEEEALEHL